MKALLSLGAAALAASAIVACAGQGANPGPPLSNNALTQKQVKRARSSVNPITHVFIIVQENRSVDNLFNGLPGANTVTVGKSTGPALIPLAPEPIATPLDLGHLLASFNQDTGCPPSYGKTFACPMDGFPSPNPSGDHGAYAYVDNKYTKPYFAMAEAYAFGDNMFPSHIDASFVSHQYLIAGQANGSVNIPSPEGCPNGEASTLSQQRQINGSESVCFFNSTTIADELTNAANQMSWRYYVAPAAQGEVFWDPFYYIAQDRHSPNIIEPPSQFLKDISGNYNTTLTWITPTFKNSDHAGLNSSNNGPNWVAAVVNAIGTSSLWNNSVIFVTWDDWGGWYDHVSPPYKDYDGLGIRVPFMIISPYTKQGLVTHTQYEQASILKFVEDQFGLSPLSAADKRATDPAPDVFSNTGSTPRPFATFLAPAYSSPDDPGDPDADG